jgi:cytochrome c
MRLSASFEVQLMISRLNVALLFLSALCAVRVAAAQEPDTRLARANNCLACHQIDSKRVGPAFSVIAQRFAGSDGARDYLANAIRSGSRGRWGAVPMPAQTQVSQADAQLLAAWILSLAQPQPETAAGAAK